MTALIGGCAGDTIINTAVGDTGVVVEGEVDCTGGTVVGYITSGAVGDVASRLAGGVGGGGCVDKVVSWDASSTNIVRAGGTSTWAG